MAIDPEDASVYLDGRFLGTGSEISAQGNGILIDPGEHVIEVVRPGFKNRELSFTAKPGENVRLDVELQPSASRAGLSA